MRAKKCRMYYVQQCVLSLGTEIQRAVKLQRLSDVFGGTSLGNPVTNSTTKSQFISEGFFFV